MSQGGQGKDDDNRLTPKKWGALAAAMICIAMTLANSETTVFAASDIGGGLGAGADLGAWTPTAYWFGDLLIIPFTLLLSRIFSPRWWLVVNIALYATFCALSGLQRDIGPFLVLRFLQGLTGGALSPLALSIALTTFAGPNQPIGLLIYGLVATAILPLMALVAGVFVVALGWGGVFVLLLGPALLAIGLAVWAIPDQPISFKDAGKQDWMGALIFGGSLACLAGAMGQSVRLYAFASPVVDALTTAGVALFVVFLVHDLTMKTPLINMRLVRRPEFSLGMGLNAVSRFGLLAYSTALPAFFTIVRGFRPERFGWILLLVSLPQVLTAPLIYYLIKRLDERWILSFGLVLVACGCWIDARVAPDWGLAEFAPGLLLQGMGQAFLIVPILIIVVSRASEADTLSYNIMFNSVRDFGSIAANFVVGWLGFYRSHLHAARILEEVSPDNPFFAEGAANVARLYGPAASGSFVTHQVTAQVVTLTEADVLVVLGIIMAGGLGLTWLIPRPPPPNLPLATVELDRHGLHLETPDEKPPQPPPPDEAAPQPG